jgi:hypothetical protein
MIAPMTGIKKDVMKKNSATQAVIPMFFTELCQRLSFR